MNIAPVALFSSLAFSADAAAGFRHGRHPADAESIAAAMEEEANAGTRDFYHPDHDTAWSLATCVNTHRLSFGSLGRPTFDSTLACCKGTYWGQVNGACLAWAALGSGCTLLNSTKCCAQAAVNSNSQKYCKSLGCDLNWCPPQRPRP